MLAPPRPEQVGAEHQPFVLAVQISVELKLFEHGAEDIFLSVGGGENVVEGDSLHGASESENRLGRRVAVRIERSFQPRSMVVEVRRSAGPRERVREALVDVARVTTETSPPACTWSSWKKSWMW